MTDSHAAGQSPPPAPGAGGTPAPADAPSSTAVAAPATAGSAAQERHSRSSWGAPALQSPIGIESEHLLLRDFEETDFEGVHAYASDEEVVRQLIWGPNTEEDSRHFLAKCALERTATPRTTYTLCVVDRGTSEAIGACRLTIPFLAERNARVSFVLNRAFWRRGFMAEAVRAAVNFGFEGLGLNRIYGTAPVENWGSALVLEKAGMKKEARFDKHIQGRGERWLDAHVLSITREEWKKSRRRG